MQTTARKAIGRFWADTALDSPNGWANHLIEERVDEDAAYRWTRLRKTEKKELNTS